ncbi:MAG: hypothetical protein COU72_02965, partial [Parcubacteria group bacterium CG10_big_fil_rev_8_21_14_0_10_41_35]
QDFEIKTNPRLAIEDDLKRRDFTINAMAYNLATEELIDPHQGQLDLKTRLIKCVGKPEQRFEEDYSRILRALRFSIQLGFDIEEITLQTLKQEIVNINNKFDGKRVVPFEVISEEFLKSLETNAPDTVRLWDSSGALIEYIPELLKMKGCAQPENWHAEGDVWEHALLGLEKLSSKEFKKEFEETPNLELIISILFHDIGKPYTIKTPKKDNADRIRFDEHENIGAKITKQALERVKISAPPELGVDPDCIAWLVGRHMLLVHGKPNELNPKTIEKYFFSERHPSENLFKLIFIDGLSSIRENGSPLIELFYELKNRIADIKKQTKSHGKKLAKPLITGHDVMETLSLKPSERIGHILDEVRQKQLSGELKSKQEALEYLKV